VIISRSNFDVIKEVLTSLVNGKGIRKRVEAGPARSPVSYIEIQMRVAIYQLTIWTILQQFHDWFQHLKKRISLPRALRELTPVNLPRDSRRCDNICW